MREIKPSEVPAMMLSGELRFGMELEFRDDNNVWTKPMVLTGLSIWGTNGFEHKGMFFKYARFPLPKLRDGDPVVVWDVSDDKHKRIFKSFSKIGEFICYSDGLTKWTTLHDTAWKYGEPATKSELKKMGYSADQISELESRGCVG